MRLELILRKTLLCAAINIVLCEPASTEPMIIGDRDGKDIVTVRGAEVTRSKQALPMFPGISNKTAGATGLSLLKVVIPPGGSAEAHVHEGYESAIYLIQGRVETRYGKGLSKSIVNKAGDFVFIPADVPHKPTNLSQTEPAIAIVARNNANEQEHVKPYAPDDTHK